MLNQFVGELGGTVLELVFIIWLYIFLKSTLNKRKERPSQPEEDYQETFEMPDIEQENLPEQNHNGSRGGSLYKDGDSHVHTDEEKIQHDKGKRYRDGDTFVHTDEEQLKHDKGRLYRPAVMQQTEQSNAEGIRINDSKAEKSNTMKRTSSKSVKKRILRTKLVDGIIIGEILGKPKGLE